MQSEDTDETQVERQKRLFYNFGWLMDRQLQLRVTRSSAPELFAQIITSQMEHAEIVRLLKEHGCADLASRLDGLACSQRPIANGGLGDVYRGRLDDGTMIAIKTIREYDSDDVSIGVFRKRAARELYTWSRCKHPNVVELLGLDVFNNSLAMISRWEENGNLTKYLSAHPSANRWDLSLGISNGLKYLYLDGIVSASLFSSVVFMPLFNPLCFQVHGDIKGANVLIAEDGRPMLMDFGNASLSNGSLGFTQTKSTTKYSVRWAAPEMFEDEGIHTTASDIYALGMTILETYTSQPPFQEKKSDMAVMMSVGGRREIPIRPQEMIMGGTRVDDLWELLKKCWSYEPKDRPSAVDVYWKMRNMELMDS